MIFFDFLKNLPFYIFILVLFGIFSNFIRGGFILLKIGEEEEIERGRRIILTSLYSLFVLLLITFVFFLVTYLLQQGEVLKPLPGPGGFPASPFGNFPPAPQFIKIGGYYFAGPFLLSQNNSISSPAVYSILCKTDEEYDIIYIGETAGKSKLLQDKQYKCWVEECDNEIKNLYVAMFWMPVKDYSYSDREKFRKYLEDELLPLCSQNTSLDEGDESLK